MRRITATALALIAVGSAAAPAHADTRYLAYNASDRITQALTKGVTLQVRRGPAHRANRCPQKKRGTVIPSRAFLRSCRRRRDQSGTE